MTKTPTMAELRIECAKLGITPARSITETMARIEMTILDRGREVCGAEDEAMRAYSAEMRRMDAMGEAAWMAEQFKPRMSRLMRHMADSTSLSTGILRAHPIVYQGDFVHQREGAAFVLGQIRMAARDVARLAMLPPEMRAAAQYTSDTLGRALAAMPRVAR